jgi:hypothetical protein
MVALVLLDHLLLQERIESATSAEHVKRKLETIEAEMRLLEMQKALYEEELAALSR